MEKIGVSLALNLRFGYGKGISILPIQGRNPLERTVDGYACRDAGKSDMKQWIVRAGIRSLMFIYEKMMRVAIRMGPRKRPFDGNGCEILLTGTFYSENWIASHLKPLSMSKRCSGVQVVTSDPVPSIEKVEVISPPAWLVRLLGKVPARLATFIWVGIRTRPHYVGGFHLLFNGLAAALLGKIAGCRSVYFCVGGPAEVLGGGILSENRIFGKLDSPNKAIERKLVQAVAGFDLVVTMGSDAVSFLRERGVSIRTCIVSGGLDTDTFRPSSVPPSTDLIFVGRLASIKCIDLFLQSVRHVKEKIPNVKVKVVGDGPMRESLEQMAHDLGIEGNVTFCGHRKDVDAFMKDAKIFVLTSESEGLSLSLMEAMLCGLPAVVSGVGGLGDLVRDNVNGYLISERTPEAFSEKIVELLMNETLIARFSEAARKAAERYDVSAATALWDDILAPTENDSGDTERCAG